MVNQEGMKYPGIVFNTRIKDRIVDFQRVKHDPQKTLRPTPRFSRRLTTLDASEPKVVRFKEANRYFDISQSCTGIWL